MTKKEMEKNNEKKLKIKNRIFEKILTIILNSIFTVAKILNLFIKIKKIKVTRYGKSFYVTGNLKYFLHWKNKSWEYNTHRIFSKFLDKDHSYIDVGAFIGATVLYGVQFAKKVYAIEPDPIAFDELEKNVLLNPSLKEKIRLYKKCIYNKTQKVKFGSMTGGGDSISSLRHADSKISWEVDGITIEDFIKENKIDDCNFIKMDIEGGEALVLPSMKNYLMENKTALYLSMHPRFFSDSIEDTRKIIDVLKIYKNIYTDNGEKIKTNDLLLKERLNKNYAIIATDNEYNPNWFLIDKFIIFFF